VEASDEDLDVRMMSERAWTGLWMVDGCRIWRRVESLS